MNAAIEVSRGVIARMDLEESYVPCLSVQPLFLHELLNREYPYEDIGLLIDPMLTK
jgi:hypothetical protein